MRRAFLLPRLLAAALAMTAVLGHPTISRQAPNLQDALIENLAFLGIAPITFCKSSKTVNHSDHVNHSEHCDGCLSGFVTSANRLEVKAPNTLLIAAEHVHESRPQSGRTPCATPPIRAPPFV